MNDDKILEVKTSEPFTAKGPWRGLEVWGPADAPKEIIEEHRDEDGYKIVKFKFLDDGTIRTVRLLGNQKEEEKDEMEITPEEIGDRILDNVRPVDPDAIELEGVAEAAEEIVQLIEERR